MRHVAAALAALCMISASPALGADRGLCWPNADWVPMSGFESPNTTITTYYNWSPDPDGEAGFPFVPMLWGCNATYTTPFEAALNASFGGANLTSSREVLGFNEPDQSGQSNCSPEEAAQAWIRYLEPLKARGYRLGSPATTGGTYGRTWLLDFYAACAGGCNPDFVALHWVRGAGPLCTPVANTQYDMSTSNFISTMQSFHSTFGLPIWVTGEAIRFCHADQQEMAVQNFTTVNASTSEYGAQATQPEIYQIFNETLGWADQQDWIEKVFWFGAMYDMQGVNDLDSLFLASGASRRTGALNELGVMYAGSNGSLSARHGGSGGYSGAGTLRPAWAVLAAGVILAMLL